MKKILPLILSISFTIPTLALAQQADKKDLLFLGGTVGANDYGNTKATVGLEALYLRKIWGNFAVGGGANYSFGLPLSKIRGTAPAFDNGTISYPAFNWENSTQFHDYGLSLLIGAVFDHSSGGRTAILFGPEYGETKFNTSRTQTYTGTNLADEFSSPVKTNSSYNEKHWVVRVGGYHQFNKTNWTVGLNARHGLMSDYSEIYRFTDVKMSIGYAF